jgi:fucose permease
MKKYVHYNIWIDYNTNKFGWIIFISTLISIISLMGLSEVNNKFFLLGIFLLMLISIQAILRNKWNQKDIDMSEYFDLPEIGDIIVVTNADKFNFYLETQSYYVGSQVETGDEFQITYLKVTNKKVLMDFKYDSKPIGFFDYYKTKKYWCTKSDIRNKKLAQLGL